MSGLSSIDRRLGQSRVDYKKWVRLSVNNQKITTQAANLSESGICVFSGIPCNVGTEVACEFPVSQQDQWLTVRGKVIWVAEDQHAGMGIEFMDVSDLDLSLLRRVVQEGVQIGWTRPVTVWFEGTSRPTRAKAVSTSPTTLLLDAELPFLRLESNVLLCFCEKEGESYLGILQDAVLHSNPDHPIPRLSLSIRLLAPESTPLDRTWNVWPPPPDEEVKEELDQGPPLLQIEATSPEADDPTEEVVIEVSLEDQLTPSVETTGEEHEQTFREPLHGAETLLSSETSSESSPETPPPARATWEFAPLDPSEQSQWTFLAKDVLPRRSQRRYGHLLLWLAAIGMVGATAASMIQTNLWSRVQSRLEHWLLPAQELVLEGGTALLAVSAETPRLPQAITGTASPSPSKHLLEKNSEPPPAPPAARPSASSPVASPFVAAGEKTSASLIIPIVGSFSGATSYPLAEPEGLVINLPNARAKAPLGDYALNRGGFRLVWLRSRGSGGIHLRVFFAAPHPSYKIQFEGQAVHVTRLAP
jgi:hypothetical protein